MPGRDEVCIHNRTRTSNIIRSEEKAVYLTFKMQIKYGGWGVYVSKRRQKKVNVNVLKWVDN